ncbi:MAG: DUF1553 domain-containing protein [Planctomycetota bacterium]
MSEYSDQIFDYLTAEMLEGPKPPDLRSRIVDAWSAEQEQVASQLNDQAEAITLPPLPTPGQHQIDAAVKAPPVAPPVQLAAPNGRNSGHSASPNSQGERTANPLAIASLALTALVLLAVSIWAFLPRGNENFADAENAVGGTATENLAGDPKTNPVVQSEDALTPNENELEDSLPKVDVQLADERSRNQKPLNLDNLPFAPNGKSGQPLDTQLAENNSTRSALPATEIVAELDSSFAAMWHQLGINPAQRMPNVALEAKMQSRLIGLTFSGDSSSSEFYPSEDFVQAEVAQEIVESSQFADHWASRLMRQLVGNKNADDSAHLNLVGLTASQIEQGNNYNEFIGQLLASDIANDAQDEFSQASKFVYTSLAGGENHRLLGRLGSNFLNTNMACSKCHDGSLGAGQTVAGTSLGVVAKAVRQQTNYWSMLAMLNGVDAKRNQDSGSRELVDSQALVFDGKSPKVFFDLLDGQISSAEAILPDGTSWQATGEDSPRAALANWIASSELMDKAVVNQTWKLLFGRHLVPQISGLDVVAIPEREEMLSMLSSQYAAHGRDMRQLVQWIASSDVFSRSSVVLTRHQWLDAEESELENLQVAEMAFAAQGSLGSSVDAASIDKSLAMVERWSADGGFEIRSTLANLSFEAQNNKKKKLEELKLEMPSMSFLVHRDLPNMVEEDFIKKLRDSNLSWAKQVEHVALLGNGEMSESRLEKLSEKLLNYHQEDQYEALVTLLWCIKNVSAELH